MFEMDHEPVNVALKSQDYLKKWVYLVEQQADEPRQLQSKEGATV